jgi:hypothetical protein
MRLSYQVNLRLVHRTLKKATAGQKGQSSLKPYFSRPIATETVASIHGNCALYEISLKKKTPGWGAQNQLFRPPA